jgi:hypothetical protein
MKVRTLEDFCNLYPEPSVDDDECDDFDDFNDWDDFAEWMRHRDLLERYLQADPVRINGEGESFADELAGTKYAAALERDAEVRQQVLHASEQQIRGPTERILTGVLQGVASAGGHALSTVTWGSMPVGAFINGLLGTLGLCMTLRESELPAVRVVGQALQTLLHDQLPSPRRSIRAT